MQTVSLLSKHCDKSNGVFSKRVLDICRFIPSILTGKYRDSVGQKAHRLSVHVKTTGGGGGGGVLA